MTTLIADTHVHLYPSFSVPEFLSGAAANFTALADRLQATQAVFMLCFVDVKDQNALDRLSREAEGWKVETHSSHMTLRRSSNGVVLHAVPGHQLTSSESLEVLALHCRMTPPVEPQPLEDLLRHITDAGGIPVVPWGVGKWTGARAQVIQALSGGRPDVRFADNGNRLKKSSVPAILRDARDHGGCPLAGSDPLPLDTHAARAGTYCTVWEVEGGEAPDQLLHRCLTQPLPLRWAGELTSPFPFLRDQLLMQWNKRMGT